MTTQTRARELLAKEAAEYFGLDPAFPGYALEEAFDLSIGEMKAILRAIETALRSERAEVGWLVEEDAGGFFHWIALAKDKWPRHATMPIFTGRKSRTLEYQTPIERVKNASDALRFARQEDAEAFIKLFDGFLLFPKATEHCWPGDHPSPSREGLAGEGDEHPLPPSLAVSPNIPWEEQTIEQLIAERDHWEQAVSSAPGFASANAADGFRKGCEAWIAKRTQPAPPAEEVK